MANVMFNSCSKLGQIYQMIFKLYVCVCVTAGQTSPGVFRKCAFHFMLLLLPGHRQIHSDALTYAKRERKKIDWQPNIESRRMSLIAIQIRIDREVGWEQRGGGRSRDRGAVMSSSLNTKKEEKNRRCWSPVPTGSVQYNHRPQSQSAAQTLGAGSIDAALCFPLMTLEPVWGLCILWDELLLQC